MTAILLFFDGPTWKYRTECFCAENSLVTYISPYDNINDVWFTIEVPSTLMPFKPDKAEPLEQEFLVMSMMTPSMTASYIHANTQRAEIQVTYFT